MALSNTRINPYSVPAGGWHFQEGNHIVRGYDFDDLVRQLIADRRERKIPIGKPDEDITRYLCERNPPDCIGGAGQGLSPQTLIARVEGWLQKIIQDHNGSSPSLVSPAIAQTRAETGCIGCPKNQSLGCCGNKQPQGVIGLNLASIRAGRDVQRYAGELYGCSEFGWCNRTAIHLAKPSLGLQTADLPASLPARCWVPGAIKS